jgi:hypothetical protein
MFEVYPGLEVRVGLPGERYHEWTGGWVVEESDLSVQVKRAANLDDKATWGELIAKFQLSASDGLEENARLVALKSVQAIVRDVIQREGKSNVEIIGSVLIESKSIRHSEVQDEIVAAMCDALKKWFEWLWPIIDELKLPGNPEFDLDLSIPIEAKDGNTFQRLAVTADHFSKEYLGVVRSADPAAFRTSLLPSLIAVPYAIALKRNSFRDRFEALMATCEAFVRYLAVLALSPMPAERKAAFNRLTAVKELGRRPTLGQYVATVRERQDRLSALAPNTGSALWRANGKPTDLGDFLFRRLTEMRNSLQGHAGIKSESAYVAPAQTLQANLDQFLDSLANDSHSLTPVVYETGDVRVGATAAYKYRFWELRGDSVAYPRSSQVTDRRLDERTVYLLHKTSSSRLIRC